MMGFKDPFVIEDFVRAQSHNPMPRKVQDGRSVYLSHNNFGPLRSSWVLPKIGDFGLAHSMATMNHKDIRFSQIITAHPK